MEHWKDIIETNGKYQISDLGRVKNIRTKNVLSLTYSNKGFMTFHARFNGHSKNLYVHRVEYEAFIVQHEIDSNIRIIHKNGNKKDNHLSNLCIGSDETNIPKDEHFKIIPGTDGKYSVGDLGDVIYNCYIDQKHIRKLVPQHLNNGGYCLVSFYYNKIRESHLVHRLVAQAFIPNPDNKLTVNHIDEDKTNNKVSNLEWMTTKEQNTYGKFDGLENKLKLCTTEKPVLGKINGRVTFKFRSIHEASRQLNISEGSISNCCIHRQDHAGKSHGQLITWEFLN